MSDRMKTRARIRRIVSCPHDWDWSIEREEHHGKMKYRRECLWGCGAVSWTEREPPEHKRPEEDPVVDARIEDHDTPGRMDPDSQWQQEREDEADGWE